MLFETDFRRNAKEIANRLPVVPIQIIVDNNIGIIAPLFAGGIQGVGNAQRWLDQALVDGRVIRVKPGTKAKIIYWSGESGIIAAFNEAGVQVGFGQVKWNVDPRGRERENRFMCYDTAYIVASEFTGRGLGSTMKEVLETHTATNNQGIGAGFFSSVQAQSSASIAAAHRMIDGLGAVQSEELPQYKLRMLLKKRHYDPRKATPGIAVVKSDKIITKISY